MDRVGSDDRTQEEARIITYRNAGATTRSRYMNGSAPKLALNEHATITMMSPYEYSFAAINRGAAVRTAIGSNRWIDTSLHLQQLAARLLGVSQQYTVLGPVNLARDGVESTSNLREYRTSFYVRVSPESAENSARSTYRVSRHKRMAQSSLESIASL